MDGHGGQSATQVEPAGSVKSIHEVFYNLVPTSSGSAANVAMTSGNTIGNSSGTIGGASTTTISGLGCTDVTAVSLTIGGQGRVTPGDVNNLRASPSTSGQDIGDIPGSGEFTVVGGPECANGYQWWQVSYGGQTGSTVAGSGGVPWVENLSENSFDASNIEMSYYFSGWDQSYRLVLNPRTCAIVDGSEVVATELVRFNAWVA